MDLAEIDESGHGLQYFCKCIVNKSNLVKGQSDVYLLETDAILPRPEQLAPRPGQFYLLKRTVSSVEYGRPISVYHSEERVDLETGLKLVKLQFLILKKGKGTKELASLLPGDEIQIIGPLGNGFTREDHAPVCIVGGGIGVAPVAFFAESLPEKSYDFFASFRGTSYGLENVKAKNLIVTSEDGSEGIRGILSAALTADVIKEKGYKAIYACGPIPMLAYLKDIAKQAGVRCYVSMEAHMLCGVGACLGCTIPTTDGNARVCKDGPVFDAEKMVFAPPVPKRKPLPVDYIPDTSVRIAGVKFSNPIIAASGTFGFGQNYRGLEDVDLLGGIVGKGVTLEPRLGNSGQRIIEVASGNINSIGLQNPGVRAFIQEELPEMLKLKPVAIANLAGSDLESYVEGAALLDATDIPMIELNISCPNVKAGGQAWGLDPEKAASCVAAVRKACKKPLMVKLSPNAPDIVEVAIACVDAGADALSLINTISAVSIDIERARPVFDNVRAGLCGPAIKPIALRMVYDVASALKKLPSLKQVPIVGMGGISCWQDAVEFIMAGASAVQVGSAKFSNPHVMEEIITGLVYFMKSRGYRTVDEMVGLALL
ncbi:MAG: dihydroorotate dehydrogenase [Treponema sp.]|nr:dihydroorotate dehydrogenase [Treponema sp.]